MNHAEIVSYVMGKSGIPKREAEEIVKLTMEAIAEGVLRDGEAKLNGVGILKIVDRKARTGTNPSTGEEIKIPASRNLKINAAKSFKEKLNS